MQRQEQLSGLGKLILGTIITTGIVVSFSLLLDLIKNYSSKSNGNSNIYNHSERLLVMKYK